MATRPLLWGLRHSPSKNLILSTYTRGIPRRICSTRELRRLSTYTRGIPRRTCSTRELRRLSAFESNDGRSFTSDISTEKYLSSPLPSLSIPNKAFTEFMFSSIKQYGDITAMIDFPTGRSYTYTQLHDAAIKLASALYKLGYRKGDVLLIFSTNCPEFGILTLACGAVGIIISPCNPTYTPAELARQMEECGAKVVVTLPEMVRKVRQALSSNQVLSEKVKEIIVIGESQGCRPFFPLLEDDGKSFPQNIEIDPHNDIVALPYSSGTSGLPKGVMLSHSNLVSNVTQLVLSIPMEAGKDRLLLNLPMFHIYGLVASMYLSLAQGVTGVTMPQFVPDQYIEAVQKYKITQLQVVPPLVVFLMKSPLVEASQFSSVKKMLCAAAPLGKEMTSDLIQKFDTQFIQAFGMTEASPGTHVDQHPPTIGTVGQLIANTDGKIVDTSTGVDLGADQEGELCIRGPQVMKGYLNNEKATRETIIDNWLHTGDIGFYDKDGYFTITDRLKELIKYKGFQVPPAELEALILTHPDVLDCGVIGVPDEEAGELPRAYVVPKHGIHLNTDDVAKFVEKNVAHYKRLRGGIEIIDTIPKSLSGKILRRELREKAKK